jgi:hypothetical protein
MFPIIVGIGIFNTGCGYGSVSFIATVGNRASRPTRNEAASSISLTTETWAKITSTTETSQGKTNTR